MLRRYIVQTPSRIILLSYIRSTSDKNSYCFTNTNTNTSLDKDSSTLYGKDNKLSGSLDKDNVLSGSLNKSIYSYSNRYIKMFEYRCNDNSKLIRNVNLTVKCITFVAVCWISFICLFWMCYFGLLITIITINAFCYMLNYDFQINL